MNDGERDPRKPLGKQTEARIGEWRSYLLRHRAIHAGDGDELEDHLRGHINALVESGLAADEAFLVAALRIGRLDALTREFAREHSDRLWKQLVGTPDPRGVAEIRPHRGDRGRRPRGSRGPADESPRAVRTPLGR